MSKLIPAVSLVLLCGFITNPIKNAEAAKHKHAASLQHHHNHSSVHHRHSRHRLSHHVAHHRNDRLGLASWYGNQFHGHRTANGETYDMYALTAAHNSLPLSSYAEVTNVKNNRSVIVRINDRGPHHKRRVMDLSYAAARELGIHKTGTGTIKITPLSSDAKSSAENSLDNPG